MENLWGTPLTQTHFPAFYIAVYHDFQTSLKVRQHFLKTGISEREREISQRNFKTRSSVALLFWGVVAFSAEAWRRPCSCWWSWRWRRPTAAQGTGTFAMQQPLSCSQALYHLFKTGRLSRLPSDGHGKHSLSIRQEAKHNLSQHRLGIGCVSCERRIGDETTAGGSLEQNIMTITYLWHCSTTLVMVVCFLPELERCSWTLLQFWQLSVRPLPLNKLLLHQDITDPLR